MNNILEKDRLNIDPLARRKAENFIPKRPPRLDHLEAGRVGLAPRRERVVPVRVAFPNLAVTAVDLELRSLPNGHIATTRNGI